MPMGKGYGGYKSSKMPMKGKKSSNAKSNGGDKGMGAAGVPMKSGQAAGASGYGSANVKGSVAKTFC